MTDWGAYFRALPRAERAVEAAREPHPAPVVSSRDPRPESACEPSAVRTLAEACRDAGWAVRVQYSRGAGQHGTTGRALAVKDRWAVCFARDGWQGYAVHDGAWASICVAGRELAPVMVLGRTELGLWLAEPRRAPGWYAEIVQRRAAQKAAARASAAARPKKAREDGG